VERLSGPDGKLAHAELQIGTGRILLAEENPEWGNRGALSFGGTPVYVVLFVEDVDAVVARAVAAGARVVIPVADQFYGDRSGRVQDPLGHIWLIATHKEDVPPEQMQQRFEDWMKRQAGG
jgi:PhnB protein